MRLRALLVLLIMVAALGTMSEPALAAAPPPPAPRSAPPAPAHQSSAQPVSAQAHLLLAGIFDVHGEKVTLPGRAVTVTAVLRPWVPGQHVRLEAIERGQVLFARLIALTPSRRRVFGGVMVQLTAPAAGVVTLVLTHSRSAGASAFSAQRRFTVLSERVRPGSTGRFVQLLQGRLAARHLFLPQTGVFDQGTELALNAYHRLLGGGEGDVAVNPATVGALLDGRGVFHVRFPHQGRHAEGDLSDQVLALVDGDRVQELFPISSGKPSTPTILGSWQIYLRTPGYLPDGMYYSSFFIRGYAIHGYDPAPNYPASHGCMRMPIADAITAFDWLALGDWVDTYYS